MRTHYLFLCISVPLLASLNAAAKTTVTYIHSDILGSVIAKSNVYGRITERTDYEAYGEQTNGQKAGIGYTGHLEAPELGLTYMQQRYYDPSIGRFYSNDPAGFNTANLMTFNRYAYANNNPYKYVDPDGRVSWPVNKNDNNKVVITSSFGTRATGIKGASTNHNGADFRAPSGTNILAPQDGKVTTITSTEKGGSSILISNSDGSMNGFAHTSPASGITEGSVVTEGSIIGTSDGSGSGNSPHLHLTYREGTTTNPATSDTTPVDPITSQFKNMPQDEMCVKTEENKC